MAIREYVNLNTIDALREMGRFSHFIKALEVADMLYLFEEAEPHTILVPTNEAFVSLPGCNCTVDELFLPTNKDKLVEILKYHIIPGIKTMEDIVNVDSIESYQGDNLEILRRNGDVLINGVNVIDRDIYTKNGIIHIIDKVLIPEEVIVESNQNLIDTLNDIGNCNRLLTALGKADIIDYFDGLESYTLFAPYDKAFDDSKACGYTFEEFLNCGDRLLDILNTHIIPISMTYNDIINIDQIENLKGSNLKIVRSNSDIFVNDADILCSDIFTRNGVIHTIDKVLCP